MWQLASLTSLGMLTHKEAKQLGGRAFRKHRPCSPKVLADSSTILRGDAPETITAAFGVARSPFGCSALPPNSSTSQESAIPKMRESAPQFFTKGWREQERPRAQLVGSR